MTNVRNSRSARFNVKDSTILNITGSVPSGVQIEVLLDTMIQPIDYLKAVHTKENIDNISFETKIPNDYLKYKKIKAFYREKNKSKCFFEIKTRQLQNGFRKIFYSIDNIVTNDEGKTVVFGWVANESVKNIIVKNNSNSIIESEVKWIKRNDVIRTFPEIESDKKCGFELVIKDENVDDINLIFVSDKESSIRLSDLNCRTFLPETFQSTDVLNNTTLLFSKVLAKLKSLIGRLHFLHQKKDVSINYMEWRMAHIPSEEELLQQRNTTFPMMPKFSIVVPLYKTPGVFLEELVTSIQQQTYNNWELCFSDGSGADSPLVDQLEKLMKENDKIKVVYSKTPKQISDNTNSAIGLATGDYIVFMDHDDVLPPNALFACAKAINGNPDIQMIYTDEDKISMDSKKYFMPHFKPDYNIDLLLSMNYFCHLCVVKRTLAENVGGFNSEFDGAQDYDFVLRCIEKIQPSQICHIPEVLYHWRSHKNSTAENPESKRYAFDAGRRAIQAHFDRVGIKAKVSDGIYPGLYFTEYCVEDNPLISIIIPNKDHIDDLERCLISLFEISNYDNIEVIIVENNSVQPETFTYYKKITKKYTNVKVITWESEFNYSKINNFGVIHSHGDYLLFLNNDTEIINPDCLYQMLGYCEREDVGAVGARLFYPDNTIQHAGVIIGIGGIAGHAFVHLPTDNPGYFSYPHAARDYSAVTAACMMVKKSVFNLVNGFNEDLAVAFNDVDFCLKIRKKGYLIVYNPASQLYHFESKSRGQEDTPEKQRRFAGEIETFASIWEEILQKGDPYYNRNLTLSDNDFSLRQLDE